MRLNLRLITIFAPALLGAAYPGRGGLMTSQFCNNGADHIYDFPMFFTILYPALTTCVTKKRYPAGALSIEGGVQ